MSLHLEDGIVVLGLGFFLEGLLEQSRAEHELRFLQKTCEWECKAVHEHTLAKSLVMPVCTPKKSVTVVV